MNVQVQVVAQRCRYIQLSPKPQAPQPQRPQQVEKGENKS